MKSVKPSWSTVVEALEERVEDFISTPECPLVSYWYWRGTLIFQVERNGDGTTLLINDKAINWDEVS